MAANEVGDLTGQHGASNQESSGLSFEGKALNLDDEAALKSVVKAISRCRNLQFLNLQGNDVTAESAKALGGALEAHPELRRALWSDVFPDRCQDGIPIALSNLTHGLVRAGAALTELELSDNSLGLQWISRAALALRRRRAQGAEALSALLRCPACQRLEVLRVDNNGLGPAGGRLLAAGLLEGLARSADPGAAASGPSLALRVLGAGRNRLENAGAAALAEALTAFGSLRELRLPRNDIDQDGMLALAKALRRNQHLEVLDLNDNIVTSRGALALASALAALQRLRELDLGECMLRSKGAILLAETLLEGHADLESVAFNNNEIGPQGALALATSMRNKDRLRQLRLDGNRLGDSGRSQVLAELEENGHLQATGSLSDGDEPLEGDADAGSSDSEEEEDDDDDDDDDDEDDDDDDDDEDDDDTEDSEGDAPSGPGRQDERDSIP